MAFPNQTIYNAGQAGQGTAPATVDFVALSPNEYNVTEAQGTATFPISGISKVRNNDGGTTFNGEVRAVTDGFKPSDGQQIKVSLVLRDKQGAIIYGEMAFVDWPDNGQSMPFSILVYDLPDYTSYESYAQILVVRLNRHQAALRAASTLVLRRAWPNTRPAIFSSVSVWMMVRIGPMQMAEAKPFTTSISKYASRL